MPEEVRFRGNDPLSRPFLASAREHGTGRLGCPRLFCCRSAYTIGRIDWVAKHCRILHLFLGGMLHSCNVNVSFCQFSSPPAVNAVDVVTMKSEVVVAPEANWWNQLRP